MFDITKASSGKRRDPADYPVKPENRCEPAYSIIRKFGGTTAVHIITGCQISGINRWRMPKGQNGGTGGLIPTKYITILLQYASDHAVDATAAEFFPVKDARQADKAAA